MSEDKTKITLEYLRQLRTNEIEPFREKVSEMRNKSSQHYSGDSNDSGGSNVNVPFGNGALMPSADALSKQVATLLLQFTDSVADLEKRLISVSQGIRDSEYRFDDLESDAELDASQVDRIISGNAPSVSGGSGYDDPASSTDSDDSTSS